jgi:amidohydrolase
VDAVFFGHSSAAHPVGSVSVKAGPVSAASNPFTVTFQGKGAHGAAPHRGTDVILAASQAIVALQSISSRRTDPVDSAVISVGAFHAGTAGNILPETAQIRGIIRTLTPETRERTVASFRQIVGGIATAMGVEAKIEVQEGYAATANDTEMARRVRDAAAALFGADSVYDQEAPSLGTEDVGYFFREAPGCYYHIGVGNPEKGYIYAVHSPHFVADPQALPGGAALYVRLAEAFLQEE